MPLDAAGPGRVATSEKLAFLSLATSYPGRVSRVEVIETHMSWVFLTDDFAYKLLKPIRLPFLDFRSPDRRRRNCEESLRLNRRLAGSVYLGIVEVCADAAGNLSLDGAGTAVDWLIWMRRVPESVMLHHAIARDGPDPVLLRRCADMLADFYAQAAPIPIRASRYLARLRAGRAASVTELRRRRFRLPVADVQMCDEASRHALTALTPVLAARAEDRRIVEAHGDLRPEHVCLEPEPVIIDCLEFDRELRLIDPLDELAYFDLECELLQAPDIGPVFFEADRERTGDDVPVSLLDFYRLDRALLRAKIAAWHIYDYPAAEHAGWLAQARAYLALARRYAARLGDVA